jgi:hypothetical protein
MSVWVLRVCVCFPAACLSLYLSVCLRLSICLLSCCRLPFSVACPRSTLQRSSLTRWACRQEGARQSACNCCGDCYRIGPSICRHIVGPVSGVFSHILPRKKISLTLYRTAERLTLDMCSFAKHASTRDEPPFLPVWPPFLSSPSPYISLFFSRSSSPSCLL